MSMERGPDCGSKHGRDDNSFGWEQVIMMMIITMIVMMIMMMMMMMSRTMTTTGGGEDSGLTAAPTRWPASG